MAFNGHGKPAESEAGCACYAFKIDLVLTFTN